MNYEAANLWASYALERWAELEAGAHLPAPPGMPPPAEAGFTRPRAAERVGQAADWILSLVDGSRLHVHEYPDGTLVMHRDRHDPGRSLLAAAKHLFGETRVGRHLAAAGLRRRAA